MSSRVCPACGCLNSASEPACYRCKRPFPSALGGALKDLLSVDALAMRAVVLFCLVVFALMAASDRRLPVSMLLGLGEPFRFYTTVRFGALVNLPGVPFEWWRLVSAMFVHADMLHVAMNLWGLISFGAWLEGRFGPARAFLIFFLAGVLGFYASALWGTPITRGASGGVFGVIGASIGVLIRRKDRGWREVLFQQLAYALIIGLVMRADTAAHIGGFVVGVGLGALFESERRRPVVTALLGGIAGVGALTCVASVVLSVVSPLTADVGSAIVEE